MLRCNCLPSDNSCHTSRTQEIFTSSMEKWSHCTKEPLFTVFKSFSTRLKMNISLDGFHSFAGSNWHALWSFLQEIKMSFTGRFNLKAQTVPREYQQREIPVQEAWENNQRNFLYCNLYQQKSTQRLPKPPQAFLWIHCCRLSGRYTQCTILQGLLLFSLSLSSSLEESASYSTPHSHKQLNDVLWWTTISLSLKVQKSPLR